MRNQIVFTDENKLKRYDEILLNEFVKYLNVRHRKKRDVYYCGVSIQIPELNINELIKDFCEKVELVPESENWRETSSSY